MSRVEEVEISRKEMRKYFELLNENETFTDVRHYLAPLVTQIADISMSLAVIADKLSEEPEEEENDNDPQKLGPGMCDVCHYLETPEEDWPCKFCIDGNMYRPRTNGKEPEGEGGPKSGDD